MKPPNVCCGFMSRCLRGHEKVYKKASQNAANIKGTEWNL